MDGIDELAKMFKERENRLYMGPQIGVVKTPPPEISVSLGEKIVLNKNNLVIAANVLSGYQRQLELDGEISTRDETGSVTLKISTPQTYKVVTGSEEAKTKIKAKMKYTNTLKKGDQVILIPSKDEQIYFLVDKAVTL